MGTYGLLRFAFPLFPLAAAFFAPFLATLAVIGIIYGALVAMVQPDLKKLVAYSSVSHLGFVVLGIAAMNTQGVQGAVFQMLSHGVSTGGLFLIVGGPIGGTTAHRGRRIEGHAASGRRVFTSRWRRSGSLGSAGLSASSDSPRAFRWDPRSRVRGDGDPVGDLYAVDVSAGELRTGDERT
jgi:NADH:ubiquinone oxidoreductase subunit 5 (subunit L)/multisubunit Na+/H+ antiporter MnhA subunit